MLLNTELARLRVLAEDHAILTVEHQKVLKQAEFFRRTIENQVTIFSPAAQKRINTLEREQQILKSELMVTKELLNQKSLECHLQKELNYKLSEELKGAQLAFYQLRLAYEDVNKAYRMICTKLENKVPGISVDPDVWKRFWSQHNYYVNKADFTVNWKEHFFEVKEYACGLHAEVQKLQKKV